MTFTQSEAHLVYMYDRDLISADSLSYTVFIFGDEMSPVLVSFFDVLIQFHSFKGLSHLALQIKVQLN